MMWKYNCKKRNQYYDAAIRLYIHENMGGRKISKIIPVSESIISRWIRNFTAETKGQVVMKSKSSIKSAFSATGTKDSEVKALQAEIRRLKWNKSNRIIGYDWEFSIDSDVNQKALKAGSLSLGWADYVFGPSLIIPGIIDIFELKQ